MKCCNQQNIGNPGATNEPWLLDLGNGGVYRGHPRITIPMVSFVEVLEAEVESPPHQVLEDCP